ncbi:MAG: glycosyltransferase family 2 protein [Desulfopila sp.]
MKNQSILTHTYPVNISVILPTFNRESTIRRAIYSVLKQTYSNFELLIIDDGSSDNTEHIVASLDDNRIKYIRHKTNRGAAAARNTGIQLSTGKFIAFQDSDDEWMCDKLEKQMAVMKTAKEDTGVIYSSYIKIHEKQVLLLPKPNQRSASKNIFEKLLRGNFIGLPSVLIKKECFLNAGTFDETLLRLQDWELFIRLSQNYTFLYIDEPLFISFYSNRSISSNNELFPPSFAKILSKHSNIFEKYPKILSKCYLTIGLKYCGIDNLQSGINYFKMSLKTNSFQILGYIMLLIAVSRRYSYTFVSHIRQIVK